MTPATVMQHLQVREEPGLMKTEKSGRCAVPVAAAGAAMRVRMAVRP